MLKIFKKKNVFNKFLEFLPLTTVIFIDEAHSQSEKIEGFTKVKRSSIVEGSLLSNHTRKRRRRRVLYLSMVVSSGISIINKY